MKYVMFQWPSLDGQSVTHVPVIFPEMLSHSDMADATIHSWHRGRSKDRHARPPWHELQTPMPVSAGFLDINCQVDMSRISETLKMGPDPQDQVRINTWRYTYGQF